jgi:hypothetical protein
MAAVILHLITINARPKKFKENSKEIYQFSGYTVFAKATFKGKDDYQKQRRHSEAKTTFRTQRKHSECKYDIQKQRQHSKAKTTFRTQRRHSKAKTTFKTILKPLV